MSILCMPVRRHLGESRSYTRAHTQRPEFQKSGDGWDPHKRLAAEQLVPWTRVRRRVRTGQKKSVELPTKSMAIASTASVVNSGMFPGWWALLPMRQRADGPGLAAGAILGRNSMELFWKNKRQGVESRKFSWRWWRATRVPQGFWIPQEPPRSFLLGERARVCRNTAYDSTGFRETESTVRPWSLAVRCDGGAAAMSRGPWLVDPQVTRLAVPARR
ncbi:hypothetical protein VUR80DRAFT_2600 [Thermomyces stellatus]